MAASHAPALSATEPLDPLPPGRIAMWLLLASDLMFFVGLLGAFLVIRAGNASLFANQQAGLQKSLGIAGGISLMISSVAMAVAVRAARNRSLGRCILALVATLLCGCVFVGLRLHEYANTLNHHTVVARPHEGDALMVFDGSVDSRSGEFTGYVAPLPTGFDPHLISEAEVARIGHPLKASLPSPVFEDIRYGPGKSIFYAMWFTFTGAHLVHVAIGMIAIAVLLFQIARCHALPKHAEYVGLCWHFIVVIGVVLFPLLYLL